jgi:predicted TIM-barrel fold metal-dependent hydrolase
MSQDEAPLLSKKPSAYVHKDGNIFFGLEAEERLLGPTLDLIGEDLFMYASDWPHWDGAITRHLLRKYATART